MSKKISIDEHLFLNFPSHDARYKGHTGYGAYKNRSIIGADLIQLTDSVVRASNAGELSGSDDPSMALIESEVIHFLFVGYAVPAA